MQHNRCIVNKTFINHIYQEQFEEKGYLILPLLDADDIEKLGQLVHQYEERFQGAFHSTHFSSDGQYKKEVQAVVCDTVFPKVAPLLTPHKPVFGNFMIKQPDGETYMQLHADWAYVDESSFRSIAVWAALVDTDENNGCLGIIEGSHQVLNAVRGPGIKQTSCLHDKAWTKKYGKLLPMKAGEVIIYDHGLMHFSPPNKSGKIRPAFNLSIVPEQAPMLHYYSASDTDIIEKYTVDNEDFFITYPGFQRPVLGKKVGEINRENFETIDARVSDKYGFGKPFWWYMKKWFK